MKVINKHTRPLTIAATGQLVDPGDSVDVDDDLGAALVEQVDRWAEADAPAKKATAKSKAAKADESEEDA